MDESENLLESESDTECEDWDSSTIVRLEPKVKQIHGFHLMPTCMPESSFEPPTKQSRTSLELRENLTTSNFITNFNNYWNKNQQFTENGTELIVDPFKVCVVQDLLCDDWIINKVLEEFNDLKWIERSMDLYEFFQTPDLSRVDSEHIKIIYEFLKCNVKNWIQQLTGQELTNISATCSLYSDTDYLLVHDDQQEDRLIAFVLYFTGPRGWLPSNGGALQLLSKDASGHPFVSVRDIVPCNNQFVFFQVTNDSYHQVSEVLNKTDCRMSINGWFHTKTAPIFDVPKYNPPEFGLFSDTVISPQEFDLDLDLWINPGYLDDETAHCIQQRIEEDSEISLHYYFKENAYQEVLNDLQSDNINWTLVGPPNRRLYEVVLDQELPSVLERFIKLFQSQQMFALLKQYTDLDLTKIRFELQRWKHGCYSLLTDHDWDKTKELDLVLYFGCQQSLPVVGGRIMYLPTEEEDVQTALITLEPVDNNLNIVFRDTARIIKYVSKYSSCPMFYILICSYME